MTKQESLLMKEVVKLLSVANKTSRLKIIEKLGKVWRRENSAEIYEAEAKDRLKISGKRILDVDSNL